MAKKFNIVAVLSSNVTKFTSGLKKGEGALGKLGKSVGKAKAGIGKAMKGIGIAVGAVVAAFTATAAASMKFLNLADAQIQAETQVAQAVKTTGAAAGYTTKQLKAMAGELQNATTYGDEEILEKVTSNLLTFTSIAGNEFKDAQSIILDMSTLLGQDLKSSAIQVGKALNDPVKGVSALSKVGVSFTEQQKEVIKKLVETGDVAGAQKVILAELNKEFGGQAAAAAKQGMGGWKQFKQTLGDIGEQIGFAILPGFQKLVGNLKSNLPKIVNFFTSFANRVIDVYNEFVDLYNKAESFRKLVHGIKAAFVTWWNYQKALFSSSKAGFKALKDGFKAIFDPDITAKEVWDNFLKESQEAFKKAAQDTRDIWSEEMGKAETGGAKKVGRFKGLPTSTGIGDDVAETGMIGANKASVAAKVHFELEEDPLSGLLEEFENEVENTLDDSLNFEVAPTINRAGFDAFQVELDDFLKQNADTINSTFEVLSGAVSAFSNIFEAAKQKELSAAGNSAKKREEIEKKYHKKQQALSIAQAIINGAVGFTKALSAAPPPFNFILAGLTAASTAGQIATISAQQFAGGGVIGGTSYTGDKIPALVNSGEMILNPGQQRNMFNLLNGKGSAGGGGDFRFVIQGYDLVALQDKHSKRNSFS